MRSRVANLKDFLPQFSSLDGLQAAMQEILAGSDGELPFGEERRAAVQEISDTKFSTWDWIYGRSRQADIVRSARLACGTVEVRLSLDHGCVTDLAFGGDFLGGLPADRLAERLRGLRFDRQTLLAALAAEDTGRYFDGVSSDELTDLIIRD